MANNEKMIEIRVQADLLQAVGDERPNTAAYAYSNGGKLLARSPLGADGACLNLPASVAPTAVRVVIGPAVDDPDLADLLRRGAQEQHLRVDAKQARLTAQFTVASAIWRCWFRLCLVRGTLMKRIVSGGVSLDLPVCNATVDIYEVDPLVLVLPRLPDWVIDRIRELIVKPFPDPGPDPGPIIRGAATLEVRSAASPHTMDATTVKALQDAASSSELRFLAHSASRLQFEQSLVAHAELIRPILCFIYPQFVTMQKVGTATTDECGHFQTFIFQSCFDTDVPDLYFKAHQRLFGLFDVTIYAPTPVACHTWWNYACGTEVHLITTNPFAITCSPCPPVHASNNWVLFTAIGNTSLKAIHGGGAPATTATNWGLLEGDAPWGGVLRPRLDFDNSLRESLGVKYYQLSWRKGTSGGWAPLTADVNRHYAHVVGSDLVIEPYKLGPNYMTVGGQSLALYEIPPALPPIGQWTVANAVLDTENGELNSVLHAPGLAFNDNGTVATGTVDDSGLYQLKLDLYTAAGVLVDIATAGIVYVVPDVVSLSGTITTVHADTVAQPGGGTLVQGNSLVLTLHIDNNHTWAGLGAPSTPAGAADPCCGIVAYPTGASVALPYTAFHPHGFATHALQLFRSATQILPTITGGTGNFTLSKTVSDMMSLELPASCVGNPPCTTAAFGEHLEVYALATDGWGSNLGYNDADNRAFALAPVPV
ncbi:MAG TPA: hypothetical protein VLM79_18340 [Kofleriaceae bacterium]|nr:hypothetical protein [Kofleriaceae bacterium]